MPSGPESVVLKFRIPGRHALPHFRKANKAKPTKLNETKNRELRELRSLAHQHASRAKELTGVPEVKNTPRIKLGNDNGLEDQEWKCYREEKAILCVKWTTFNEFLLNEARSRPVFLLHSNLSRSSKLILGLGDHSRVCQSH